MADTISHIRNALVTQLSRQSGSYSEAYMGTNQCIPYTVLRSRVARECNEDRGTSFGNKQT